MFSPLNVNPFDVSVSAVSPAMFLLQHFLNNPFCASIIRELTHFFSLFFKFIFIFLIPFTFPTIVKTPLQASVYNIVYLISCKHHS